jgi:copper oxidase (laccase) domain-containing protein
VTVAPGIEQIEGFFPSGVVALQTTRAGGVSLPPYDSFNLGSHVGDTSEAVTANRARLADHLPSSPTWLSQVHGIAAVDHDQSAPKEQTADACFTGQANRVCAVMTADCLPVLIAREDGQQVGIAHAGWRGLCAGVIENTLTQMLARDQQGAQQAVAHHEEGDAHKQSRHWRKNETARASRPERFHRGGHELP